MLGQNQNPKESCGALLSKRKALYAYW